MTEYFGGSKPRVIAHRGLAVAAPENTLEAFAAATELGIEYLETDVHVSRDGVAVLSHDPDLLRLAGLPDRIDRLTFAELERIDLGGGHRMTSLAAALDAFPAARFNIDLKDGRVVDAATRAIERARATHRVLVTSFSDARRRRASARLPGVATSPGRQTVLLSVSAMHARWYTVIPRLLAEADAVQVPERKGGVRIVTPRFIDVVHRAGAEVHVWTVNEVADMARLLDLGVDGIVTDRADLAAELVRSR